MTPGVYVALHRWLGTEFGPGRLFKVGHSADLGARPLDSAYATHLRRGERTTPIAGPVAPQRGAAVPLGRC